MHCTVICALPNHYCLFQLNTGPLNTWNSTEKTEKVIWFWLLDQLVHVLQVSAPHSSSVIIVSFTKRDEGPGEVSALIRKLIPINLRKKCGEMNQNRDLCSVELDRGKKKHNTWSNGWISRQSIIKQHKIQWKKLKTRHYIMFLLTWNEYTVWKRVKPCRKDGGEHQSAYWETRLRIGCRRHCRHPS